MYSNEKWIMSTLLSLNFSWASSTTVKYNTHCVSSVALTHHFKCCLFCVRETERQGDTGNSSRPKVKQNIINKLALSLPTENDGGTICFTLFMLMWCNMFTCLTCTVYTVSLGWWKSIIIMVTARYYCSCWCSCKVHQWTPHRLTMTGALLGPVNSPGRLSFFSPSHLTTSCFHSTSLSSLSPHPLPLD